MKIATMFFIFVCMLFLGQVTAQVYELPTRVYTSYKPDLTKEIRSCECSTFISLDLGTWSINVHEFPEIESEASFQFSESFNQVKRGELYNGQEVYFDYSNSNSTWRFVYKSSTGYLARIEYSNPIGANITYK